MFLNKHNTFPSKNIFAVQKSKSQQSVFNWVPLCLAYVHFRRLTEVCKHGNRASLCKVNEEKTHSHCFRRSTASHEQILTQPAKGREQHAAESLVLSSPSLLPLAAQGRQVWVVFQPMVLWDGLFKSPVPICSQSVSQICLGPTLFLGRSEVCRKVRTVAVGCQSAVAENIYETSPLRKNQGWAYQ